MTQTVEKWMTKGIVSTSKDEPLITGLEMMAEGQIRHVLVVDKEGHLKGILSNRDVVRATMTNPERTLDIHGTSIEQVMTKGEMRTINPGATIGQAAEEFLTYKINALPVTDGAGKVQGIITSEDVLRAVIRSECGHRSPDL